MGAAAACPVHLPPHLLLANAGRASGSLGHAANITDRRSRWRAQSGFLWVSAGLPRDCVCSHRLLLLAPSSRRFPTFSALAGLEDHSRATALRLSARPTPTARQASFKLSRAAACQHPFRASLNVRARALYRPLPAGAAHLRRQQFSDSHRRRWRCSQAATDPGEQRCGCQSRWAREQ